MTDLKEFILEDGFKIKTMNLDNYYLHAIGGWLGYGYTKYYKSDKLINILREGKLKADGQNRNHSLSPINEICLCDPAKKIRYKENGERVESAFEEFVLCSPSFVFSKDLDVYVPQFESAETRKDRTKAEYDEVRYRGKLSLEKLEFIAYPLWEWYEGMIGEADKRNKCLNDLSLCFQNLDILEKEFETIKVKDIFTGETVNKDLVRKKWATFQRTLR